MGEAVGGTLGFAVGIALSPVPIAAVILMLFSTRARVNSLCFMAAWVVGIGAVTTAVLLLPGLETDDRAPTDTAGWTKLVLGVLLLAAAVAQLRGRPGPDDAAATPGWMARIDTLRAGPAFGLGLALSALNPKNLLLAAAAGATIASIDLTRGQTVAAVATFSALAAVSVVAPVVASVVLGHRLDGRLDAAKDALIRHNKAVMAVLLVVFGLSLLGDGIQILSD